FEKIFTNSTASRAYLEIGCSSQYLMIGGQKHSLCLISMLSKAQPSESMPTKNSDFGASAASSCADIATVAIPVSSDNHSPRFKREPPCCSTGGKGSTCSRANVVGPTVVQALSRESLARPQTTHFYLCISPSMP